MLDDVQQLLDALEYGAADFITVEQLQHGLASLGYSLEPSEVLELARNLGYGVEGSEGVALSQFAASQLDWEALQVGVRAGHRGLAGQASWATMGSGSLQQPAWAARATAP
jgi:hypothetical protein